jgi:hypothetical protein
MVKIMILNEKTRLYTTVLCMSKENQLLRNEIIQFYDDVMKNTINSNQNEVERKKIGSNYQ